MFNLNSLNTFSRHRSSLHLNNAKHTKHTKHTLSRKSQSVIQSKYIEELTIDLTEKAKNGFIDPVVGRDNELLRMEQILLKRSKCNPILLAESGVGKTALVGELSRMIVNEKCATDLMDKRVLELSMNTLISGTKERGSYEEKITELLKEIIKEENIILFIDEIHTVVGKDSSRNEGITLATILKPPLARGEFQCIGCTTLNEYSKYFQNDKALCRRFQPVLLEEPDLPSTLQILHTLKPYYQAYHKCIYSNDSINACVELSDKYIHYRKRPDSSIDLMDESGSMFAINLRKYVTSNHIQDDEEQINKYINDNNVTRNDIETVINKYYEGVTIEQFANDHCAKIQFVENTLKNNMIGQNHAIDKIINCLRRKMCGFSPDNKPNGVFFFTGGTGCGKTLLANLMSKTYFGPDIKLLRFDMSEYMESHSVSSLIGAPPGYIGYDEGGKLTNLVKRNPNSVILFDEIEKAHPEIFNILLQVLDDGVLTDSHGNKFSFKNNIIIMTSNCFAPNAKRQLGFINDYYDSTETDMKNALSNMFRPEFLNRIDEIICFNPLNNDDLKKIIDKNIQDAIQLIKTNTGLDVKVNEKVKINIFNECNSDYGARPINRAIIKYILNPLVDDILIGKINKI